MHVCIFAYVHTHMPRCRFSNALCASFANIRTCIHIHAQIYMYTYTHTHIHTYTHTHILPRCRFSNVIRTSFAIGQGERKGRQHSSCNCRRTHISFPR